MKSWKTPTPEEVSKTVALLSRAGHYQHFFDRLENPRWIEPLWKRRFFKTPPAPEHEDSGYITFPRWPESRYLARMAQRAPDIVAEVLLEIVGTDNIEVREDIARAVLALPASLAEGFVNAAKEWITGRFFDKFLAMRLGELVSHLSKGGNANAALELARELLQVVPRDRRRKEGSEPSPFDFRPEPAARFDTWNYEHVLINNIPHLVDAAGFDAIVLLCDLLEEAVAIKQGYEEGRDRVDFSYIWRPAIEDHEQNLGNTVLDALIVSLRDSIERLFKMRRGSIPKIVELLEKRQWPIFQRISLHFLSRCTHLEPSLVEQRIVDEKLFDNPLVLHEYYYLCRHGFAVVSEEARQEYLSWVERGLEREEVEKWIKSRGQNPSDEFFGQIENGWRLDRLTPIQEYLTGRWADYYRLIQELEQPRHPDFASWHESMMGPDSPLSQQQLSEMPLENILTFMRTWEPLIDNPVAPSPEGFGRALSVVVAARPDDFAAAADAFQGLDPTYVRALLSGLENALRNGRHFDWKPILMLCNWVVERPQSISARRTRRWGKDPDWEWTRGRIADLVAQGFIAGEGGIPFDCRSNVWRILLPLASVPYPHVDDEHERNDAWRHAAEDSWNTVRGKAMRAVIRFAVWVKENIDKNVPAEGSTAHGFTIMPEVQDVLETHLDPELDPSPATRSVYGQWLPELVWIDKRWVVRNLEPIFPYDEGQYSLWRAAWDGYVTFPVRLSAFEILRKQYKRAIGAMASEPATDHFRSDPDSAIAEHVMTAYWTGIETMEAPDSLVKALFEKGPVKIREHALYVAGRWLHNYPGDLPAEITKRLIDLWQWRKTKLEESKDPVDSKELAQFGWWFVSGKLEPSWALQEVFSTVQICGEVDSAFQVVERLATLAQEFPEQVVDCLEILVQRTKKTWLIFSWREQAFEALRHVIKSDHPVARQKARRVINRFGELGLRDFKSLLSFPDKHK